MLKNYSNSELLRELESRLATNLLTPEEIMKLCQINYENLTQIHQVLEFSIQQESLKKQSSLDQLSPEEREQVDEYLKKHGFRKKNANHV